MHQYVPQSIVLNVFLSLSCFRGSTLEAQTIYKYDTYKKTPSSPLQAHTIRLCVVCEVLLLSDGAKTFNTRYLPLAPPHAFQNLRSELSSEHINNPQKPYTPFTHSFTFRTCWHAAEVLHSVLSQKHGMKCNFCLG